MGEVSLVLQTAKSQTTSAM